MIPEPWLRRSGPTGTAARCRRVHVRDQGCWPGEPHPLPRPPRRSTSGMSTGRRTASRATWTGAGTPRSQRSWTAPAARTSSWS